VDRIAKADEKSLLAESSDEGASLTPKWDQGSLRSASELGSEAEEDEDDVSKIPYPDLPDAADVLSSDDSEDQTETPKARHSVGIIDSEDQTETPKARRSVRIITGEESDNVLDVSVSRVKEKKKRIVRNSKISSAVDETGLEYVTVSERGQTQRPISGKNQRPNSSQIQRPGDNMATKLPPSKYIKVEQLKAFDGNPAELDSFDSALRQ